MAVDLSGGIVPTTPPASPPASAPPPGGGIDLSGGIVPTPQVPNNPPMLATPTTPPTAWQSLKQHIKDNIDSNLQPTGGVADDVIGGFSRGAMKGLLQTGGGLLDIYRHMGDQAQPADVLDYMKTHPGAMDADAIAAVSGKDVKGNPVQPYRSADNRKAQQDTKAAADWFKAHAGTEGFWEGLGSGGESIAELLGTGGLGELLEAPKAVEGGAKAVGFADSLKNSQKVASFLEANPKIAKLVSLGMRTAKAGAVAGTQAAGQTYIKTGGDAGAALEGGAIGAAGGAAAEGLASGARAALGRLAKPSTTADAVADTAKNVVDDRLGETNATRTPTAEEGAPEGKYKFRIAGTPTVDTTEGSLLQEPQKRHIGTRVVEGKGPSERQVYPPNEAPETQTNYVDVNNGDPNAPGYHKSPVYRLTEDSKPGQITRADSAAGGGTLITEDPRVATAHLNSLNEIIGSPEYQAMQPEQQAAYQASRQDIKQQIAESYQHAKATGTNTPNFQPVDVKSAIKNTGNFQDAAKQIEDVARPVYEQANSVSGGQWQALKDHITDLDDKLKSEPYDDGRAKIRQQIGQARQKMNEILDDPANGIDQRDAIQAKRNFRTAYILRDAHNAIAPLYDLEAHSGFKTGDYRGFDGRQLGKRWQSFLDDPQNREAKGVLGGDRVDTLTRLFHENETMANRKRFGNAVLSVASALAGFHLGGVQGAAEGAAAYQGIRYVLDGMISTPKIAKQLLFAIDSGARPESYAPGLARMIQATRTAGKAAIPAAAGALAQPSQEKQQ